VPHDLNVVLVEPEIPQNTGSIGRTCLATGTTLHLVEPLGFDISDAQLRRAGLDYWKHLKLAVHKSAADFFEAMPVDAPRVFFSKKAGRLIYDHKFKPGTWLIFGKETAGLPESLLSKNTPCLLKIPMYDDRVRSLNLSNAASIAVYEAIRQLGA